MKRQLKSTKLVKKYHLEEKVKEIYSNLCLEKYGKCPPTMDLKLEFEAKKQAIHGVITSYSIHYTKLYDIVPILYFTLTPI